MGERNFTNYSNIVTTPETSTGRLVLMTILSVFPPITVVGNILTICVVVRLHKFKQKANVFIVSLSVSDISVALFVMTPAIIAEFGGIHWLALPKVCLLSFSLDVMFTSTSILHLMCMTIDRYIAICKPFRYYRLMSKRVVTRLLFTCWILSALISFGLIFSEVHNAGVDTPSNTSHQTCFIRVNIYYAVICSLVVFYIPSASMVVFNVLIYRTVKRKGKQLCALSKSIRQVHHEKFAKREVKVARTIAIMLSCFFLCWLPFFVYNIVDPLLDNSANKTTIMTVTWLGYINSTFNPCIYAFLNKSSITNRCLNNNKKFISTRNVYAIH